MSGNPSYFLRGARPWILAIFLLVVGMFAGIGVTDFVRDERGIVLDAHALTSAPVEVQQGEYTFFTYRRNVWIIQRSSGRAQFFLVPETHTSEARIEQSGVYQIDQTEFPPDQTELQISERNLSNYLWISNRVTGKSYFIRARRDGGFDESPVVTPDLKN